MQQAVFDLLARLLRNAENLFSLRIANPQSGNSFFDLRIIESFFILVTTKTKLYMGILVIILYVIVGLIAIVLIAALFTKSSYTIQRQVNINRPRQQVFDYIKYINNQEYYNKWVMTDPNLKKEYRGTDGTVGYISAWDSQMKQVDKGKQQIKAIVEGKRIDLGMHFIKPSEGRAEAFMETEAILGNQTKLTWGISGVIKYPANFIMLVVINIPKMLAKDMEISLNNLKKLLENA
jgi:uncharacterized protein YndB with AHSA1/START domain